MIDLQVDERCRGRCTALAEALAACEHNGSNCIEHLQRFREHCVSNSACNPSGRQQDPAKAAKKCRALGKRVALCDSISIDGQAKPSITADCVDQRRRWQTMCTSVIVHERAPPADTSAITAAYRDAARAEQRAPTLEQLGGHGIVGRIADALVTEDGEPSAIPFVFHAYPAASIASIAAPIFLARAATDPATSALPGVQRLMQARVVGQAVIVASTALVIGLGQLVDLGLRRSECRQRRRRPEREGK